MLRGAGRACRKGPRVMGLARRLRAQRMEEHQWAPPTPPDRSPLHAVRQFPKTATQAWDREAVLAVAVVVAVSSEGNDYGKAPGEQAEKVINRKLPRMAWTEGALIFWTDGQFPLAYS